MYRLLIDNQPRKFLDNLSKDHSHRFLAALIKLQHNPFEGDIKKLQGKYVGYRLRIGKWRVFFTRDDQNKLILIYWIEKRGDIY